MTIESVQNALFGGVLIGLAASILMLTNGRIMGVSGIISGLLSFRTGGFIWRTLFLAGVVLGGAILITFQVPILEASFNRTIYSAIAGGLLVGIGTSIGSGCTSGHGVCGVSRRSIRSIVATLAARQGERSEGA